MSYCSNLTLQTAKTLKNWYLKQTMFQGPAKRGVILPPLCYCVLEHVFVRRDINDRRGSCRPTEPESINKDPSKCMKV